MSTIDTDHIQALLGQIKDRSATPHADDLLRGKIMIALIIRLLDGDTTGTVVLSFDELNKITERVVDGQFDHKARTMTLSLIEDTNRL